MQTNDEDISFLISMYDDVATVKDKENLLYTIFQILHEFYGIKISGGALYDKSKENFGFIVIKIEKDKRVTDSMAWLQMFSVNSIPFNISISNPEITLLSPEQLNAMQPQNIKHPPLGKVLSEMNINSLSLIPINTGGELIGFLVLALEGTALGEKEEGFLLRLASLIGSVYEKVNSYDELKRKEKEIQLGLLADLLPIREKESLFKKLADETNKLIPCDYIAFHTEYSSMNLSSTLSLIKDEKDQFKIMPSTRNITLFLLALKSKVNGKVEQNHLEVTGKSFDKMCEQFLHLKQLKEKNSVSSLLVLHHSYKNLGGLTVVLGRSLPYSAIKIEPVLELIFTQNREAFFWS
ncbi:MAG: GAF domain-containing protein [Ignavibacteriales bacterium]|nr:GAF domain-containing protein [Ignavibacteriales bacterium]